MRILVTGSVGFIGTNLMQYLRAKGIDAYGIDLLENGVKKVDIRDYSALSNTFKTVRPDCVVHLAAMAYPQKCETDCDYCFSTNVTGTYNVAKLAKEYNARMIFASTAAVYGKAKVWPTPVGSETVPTNLYGETKLIDESIIKYYLPSNHIIFRIFNVYGEHCDRSYVIPDAIRKLMLKDRPVPMMGTGDEERDFIYIMDVLDAFHSGITQSTISGTFNLGTGSSISMKGLTKMIAKLLNGEDAEFSFPGKPRIGDINKLMADISGDNALLGWRPATNLRDGLFKTIKYFTKS